MRKLISLVLIFVLLLGTVAPVGAQERTQPAWESAMHAALDYIESVVTTPVVGSVGGEWAVLALARAGRIHAGSPWALGWFSALGQMLDEVSRLEAEGHDISNPATINTFPSELRRWTDFQRVTIALTALGQDATNFQGHDVTAPFRNFVPNTARHALNQTINVDTYALIALDTRPYEGNRTRFKEALLDAQRSDGSWSLIATAPTSALDIDVTAMALQALAPYHRAGDTRVIAAVDQALSWLRAQVFDDPEAIAQMIVALTALGQDFASEAAYYVELILQWADPATGGFRRPNPDSPLNLMATEQAAYALVAYWRFVNGMSALYDMQDAVRQPGRHPDVSQVEVTAPGKTFPDVATHESRTAIEALAARGIITGRNEHVFDPDATMTRSEFAAITTRALGLPSRTNTADFEDIPTTAWYASAVHTAFAYQIVRGTSLTTFHPYGTITLQEAAVMVARAALLAGLDTRLNAFEIQQILAPFQDGNTVADWARAELAFLYHSGILDATTTIAPQTQIRRGEIAEMLYRMLGQSDLL